MRTVKREMKATGGRAEQIVSLIQQRYGYTRERAEEEFERRLIQAKEAVKHD